MITFRQFERLANVKFEENKFSTQRKFQQYGELMNEKYKSVHRCVNG